MDLSVQGLLRVLRTYGRIFIIYGKTAKMPINKGEKDEKENIDFNVGGNVGACVVHVRCCLRNRRR